MCNSIKNFKPLLDELGTWYLACKFFNIGRRILKFLIFLYKKKIMCNTFLMENNFCCCYSTMNLHYHMVKQTYVTKIFKLELHFSHDAFQNFKVTYYMLTKSVGAAPKGGVGGSSKRAEASTSLYLILNQLILFSHF
jgi:hypothetical protein